MGPGGTLPGGRRGGRTPTRVRRRRVVDAVHLRLMLLEIPQVAELAPTRIDRALEGLDLFVHIAL